MRAFIALLIILNSASVSERYAEFSFEKRIQKFKPVKEGETIEHTFKFTNTGEEPLIISNYSVECTCTKAQYSKEPVMPGDSGEIHITFDTKGKIGWQYRKIQLYANTKKTPNWIEIRVKVLNE